MTDPIESAELLAFVRIVDAKSLSRAAKELGVPRATISRRLSRLEKRLGVRLLRRTTRSLVVTDAGEAFYRQARVALDAIDLAAGSVQGGTGDAIRGDLRVTAPPITEESFYAAIAGFAQKHPGVRVQIDFSARHVDIRREGYDVALRATTRIEPGYIARTLRRSERIGVASPGYLKAHGTPKNVKELRNHRCITGFARGELPQTTWQVGKRTIRVDSAFSSSDPLMLAAAARAGLGIALLPSFIAESDIESGALARVLPGVLREENVLAIVYAERELQPPHVRAFIDTLVAWNTAFTNRR